MKKVFICWILLLISSCVNLSNEVSYTWSIIDQPKIKETQNILQNFKLIPSHNDDIRGGKIIWELHGYVEKIIITNYLKNEEKNTYSYISWSVFHSHKDDSHNRDRNTFDSFSVWLVLWENADFGINKYLIEAYVNDVKIWEIMLENSIDICNWNIGSISELNQILGKYEFRKISFYEDWYYVVSHQKTGNRDNYDDVDIVNMKFDILDCDSKGLVNIITQYNKPAWSIGLGDMSENSVNIIKKIDDRIFFTYFDTSKYDTKYVYDFNTNSLHELEMPDLFGKFQSKDRDIYFSTSWPGSANKIFLLDDANTLNLIYKHDFILWFWDSLDVGDTLFTWYKLLDNGKIELILSEYLSEDNFKEITKILE